MGTSDTGKEDERVAVVVVSGVGDDALGSGRTALVDTLRTDPAQRWRVDQAEGLERLIATADTGDQANGTLRTGLGSPNLRESFPVPTARLDSESADAPRVDVFEMHWADLSRAQGPLQRLAYLIFAITLQVPTMGLDAVRPFRERDWRLRWLHGSLNLMSYWMAYVLTAIVLALGALAVFVNVALLANPIDQTGWIIFAGIGALFVGVGWWVGGRIYRGGWTFDRAGRPWRVEPTSATKVELPSLAKPVAAWTIQTAALVGVVSWLVVDCDHRELAVQVMGLLGIGWLATTLSLAALRFQVDETKGRRSVRRIIQAAFAAVPAAAMLFAAFGNHVGDTPAVRSANALTSLAAGSLRLSWLILLLLCAIVAWLGLALRYMHRGRDSTALRDRDEMRRLGTTVSLSVWLGPVLYATATASFFAVFAALARVYPDYAKVWTDPGDIQCPGTDIAHPTTVCTEELVRQKDEHGKALSTFTEAVDWGGAVVKATIQPLGLALIATVILLTAIGMLFAGYGRSFRARLRFAPSVRASIDQGTAFSNGLRRSGGDPIAILVATIIGLLVPGFAIAVWATGLGWEGQIFGDIAFPVVYVLAVLAVAGVGMKNLGFAGKFGGGFLKVLALAVDLIYDIATYLRIAHPAMVAPRVQMIARYRAVLARIAASGYDRTVIFAHSQGSILSLATIYGDPDRIPAVAPLPPPLTPHNLTLTTYGCPATQTYAQRFPGQFRRWARGGHPVRQWINIYRAGDYIGRGVNILDFDPRQTGTWFGHLRERCLGSGHHTGYFGDERWRRVAREMVASTTPGEALGDVSFDDHLVDVIDGAPG